MQKGFGQHKESHQEYRARGVGVVRLDESVYTVFDVETTGLYPYNGDKICEIAAIKFTPSSDRREVFHYLIDPGRQISYGAYRVNRMSQAMLEGQPKIEEVLPRFLKFIEESVLVAYNASFDLGFIESNISGNKTVLSNFLVIDALRLARRLFSGLDRYNLGYVSRSLGIEHTGEHRALQDAETTLKVFTEELRLLYAEGVFFVEDVGYRIGVWGKAVEDAIMEQKVLNKI